jgi:hypothetical protein
MIYLNALELLRRHTSLPFGWCEVVVGYDFGILSIREIQDWIRSLALLGPEAEKVVSLAGTELLGFEASLWAAFVEATGTRVPRPGHQRWAFAQDLWRMALLKEVLAWPTDLLELGEAVDSIITRVGSPEDMLGLVKLGSPWAKQAAEADREAVEAFVRKLEGQFPAVEEEWFALAAS